MRPEKTFRFGDFCLDSATPELRKGGVVLRIQRKPLELLIHLVQRRDRLVPKEELLDALWPGAMVTEQALSSALRDLRRELGDTDSADRMVITVRGAGYRFAAKVDEGGRAEVSSGVQRSAPEVSGGGAFVGRDEVIAGLFHGLSSAVHGETQLSFIAGPPGIGKTRVASEFLRLAEARGVEAHWARCYDGDGAPSFWPWLQVLRSCMSQRDIATLRRRMGGALRHLAWIAPELVEPFSVEARGDLAGAEARFRLFDAMALFLRKIAEEQPLLIVLDDIHWADDASLLLLDFIAQSSEKGRVHLVATLRDSAIRETDTLARVLGNSARQKGVQRVDLRGFSRDAVGRVLHAAARRVPAKGFVERIFDATGGNPFFVAEISKLVESGDLDPESNGPTPIPAAARDAIRQQLGRLSTSCVRVLKLASVIGREFDIALVTTAGAGDAADALAALEEAERATIAAPLPRTPGRYSFVHDLVREAVYLELPARERLGLHRAVARALERLTANDPDARLREIAFHYFEAAADGVAREAFHHACRAGAASNAGMAFEDAVVQYDHALAALVLVPESSAAERSEVLLAQAEAAWGTEEPAPRVQSRFVAAAEAARTADSPSLLARAAIGRTGFGAGIEDYRHIAVVDPTDIALLDEASRALEGEGSDLEALVLSRLALAVRYERGFAEADALSRRAVELAEGLRSGKTLANAVRYRHEVLSGPAFVAERLALAGRLLHLARSNGLRPLELDALYFLSRDHLEAGQPALAHENGVQADALAGTMRQPGASYRSGIREVIIPTLLGQFDQAEATAERCLARDGTRHLSAEGTYRAQIAQIKSLRGDHAGVIAAFEGNPEQPFESRGGFYAVARERALSGDLFSSRRLLTMTVGSDFRGVADDHGRLWELMSLADIAAELDDAVAARPLYDLLSPFEGLMAAPFFATICVGAVARALGTLAGLLGRWELVETHFSKAVQIEQYLSPPLVALSLERHGRALARRSDESARSRSRELLGQALELAEPLGMNGVVRSCRGLR